MIKLIMVLQLMAFTSFGAYSKYYELRSAEYERLLNSSLSELQRTPI